MNSMTPPTLPSAADLDAARKLAEHEAGRLEAVSLDDLPMFLAIHGLRVTGMSDGVMMVKKAEEE